MAIFDIFSKRKQRALGGIADVFSYDNLPNPLRVQITHVINEVFGYDEYGIVDTKFGQIVKALCKEYGVFELYQGASKYGTCSSRDMLIRFFLDCDEIDRALDVVELCFRYADIELRNDFEHRGLARPEATPDVAIAELNARFREHGVGYQYESGEIIRVDSQLLHSEVVKPVLRLLQHNRKFDGANEEFLAAHEHYRHGRYKETLTEALKAFESTMKVICGAKKWSYKQTDQAKKLIEICFANGLIPMHMESQITSMRTLLESGLPTVRNRQSGHGQGEERIEVPGYVAQYALNTAATNILLLVNASGV